MRMIECGDWVVNRGGLPSNLVGSWKSLEGVFDIKGVDRAYAYSFVGKFIGLTLLRGTACIILTALVAEVEQKTDRDFVLKWASDGWFSPSDAGDEGGNKCFVFYED